MISITKNKKYNSFFYYDSRIKIILVFTVICFFIILLRIVYLNIFMGSYYKMMLNKSTVNYIYGESVPRGRILDRNGKVLVDNKVVKTIYYKKPSDITAEEEIKIAYKISKILSLDYSNVSNRSLKEFYVLLHEEEVNKLITSTEYEKLKNRKLSLDDIYELKISRIKKNKIKKMKEVDKRAAYVYYLMNKGYSYQEKIIKNKNVSDKEYVYFSENTSLRGFSTKLEWERFYPYGDTLRVILGNVSSYESGIPKEDADDYLNKGYSLNDRVGISGLEKYYEDILHGEKAKYKLDDHNNYVLVEEGKKGLDIKLSIDIDLQISIDNMLEKELMKAKREANTEYFNRSYVIIQNPNTGEILSMSGKKLINKDGVYKAYDISEGNFLSTITPGSVVKGASIMVGYNTGKLKIGDYKQDSCIYLYNLPEKCSWKTLGYINDIDALALSSNVYQYKIAMDVGGFDYYPGKQLKIKQKAFDTYRNMFYRFGLGVKTGIDYPKEEDGYKSDNRSGDLLINFAIGQYDTYTPLQLSQYVSTIANGGKRYKTHFLKSVMSDNKKLYDVKPNVLNTLGVDKKYINRVRLGFKNVMTRGTGVGYMNSAPNPSGKTGTSESFVDLDDDGDIDVPSISNNFVGYAPTDKPTMSIAAAFPDIQNPRGGKYKSYANQMIVSKATTIYFSLYDKNGKKR
ncbi:MAG: penicillin-binding protein 2 [Bacilli bacterium]|nr:penicillin-binding protein 2 [Bacilli bacterium]